MRVMRKSTQLPNELCDTVAHKSPLPSQSSVKDARAVRTRVALHNAMLSLLERKPLEQITVRDICAGAGVHYATFFRHQSGKESLLETIAAEQIQRLVALSLPEREAVDDWSGFFALCSYVHEYRALWTILLNGGAGPAMRAELLKECKRVAEINGPLNSWLPSELGVICSASLIAETLAWWLAQPADAYSVSRVAEIMHRLLGASIMAPD